MVETSAGTADAAGAPDSDDAASPAFVLTAACCRWPPSQSRIEAVRAAAGAVTDWSGFVRQVDRQRVAGLVQVALAEADLASVGMVPPPTVTQQLTVSAQRIARQNLGFAAETIRLQRLFEQAGITALVLKGVALAQLAYGSLNTKHARDIDLLVPAENADAALQLLEADGYRLVSPARRLSARQRRSMLRYGREAELVHPDRKFNLELHWRAADNARLLQGIDAHAAAQTVMLSGGIGVRTLATDDLFAYLSVHGARHAWSRLKWLADVNALLAAQPAQIEHLYRHAQRVGAGICAGQALLLCRRLLALPLPERLAAELAADRRLAKLVAMALTALAAPRTASEADVGIAGVARFVHMQFLLGRGWRFYAAQGRRALVGPVDAVRWPLPGYLHFLYPIARLPLWLWRRAAAAFGGRSP